MLVSMALKFVANRVKALLLLLLGVFRRALCCFRRRRRNSATSIPLTAVGVVPDNPNTVEDGSDLQNWNTWDDNPVSIVTDHSQNSVQQQIDLYRQSRRVSESDKQETQEDFFQDMTPRITRQAKILIGNRERESGWNAGVSARLSLAADPVSYTTSELGVWEDSPCWEDETEADWDPDSAIREKRRQERRQRQVEQQLKRQDRDQQKASRQGRLGSKLS